MGSSNKKSNTRKKQKLTKGAHVSGDPRKRPPKAGQPVETFKISDEAISFFEELPEPQPTKAFFLTLIEKGVLEKGILVASSPQVLFNGAAHLYVFYVKCIELKTTELESYKLNQWLDSLFSENDSAAARELDDAIAELNKKHQWWDVKNSATAE